MNPTRYGIACKSSERIFISRHASDSLALVV
jgi:hypothetical protein